MPSATRPRGLDESSPSQLVIDRLASAEGRAARAMARIVEAAHAIILDMNPTKAEVRDVINFLTDIGHACDERRQEWVLLFDLMGISALVEDVNETRPRGATRNTGRGPFYRPDAPCLPSGASISLDGIGESMTVYGSVVDLDGYAIAGATVETWQANHAGLFENQEPDLQPEFNLRGVFRTDEDGRFRYETVKPGGYEVPSDGPVGEALSQIGYPLRRPAHLHFLISAPGFQTVTTQVFDAKDPHLGEDAIFAVRPDLVGEFQQIGTSEQPHWRLEFTFVLARAPKAGGRGRT